MCGASIGHASSQRGTFYLQQAMCPEIGTLWLWLWLHSCDDCKKCTVTQLLHGACTHGPSTGQRELPQQRLQTAKRSRLSIWRCRLNWLIAAPCTQMLHSACHAPSGTIHHHASLHSAAAALSTRPADFLAEGWCPISARARGSATIAGHGELLTHKDWLV